MSSSWESLYFKIHILYCCDPFKSHKRKTSKGLQATDNGVVAMLSIKPGQKLYRNCMEKATKVTGHSAKEIEIYENTGILKKNTNVQTQAN